MINNIALKLFILLVLIFALILNLEKQIAVNVTEAVQQTKRISGEPKHVFLPSDWLSVDHCRVRHNLHPGLHIFGCVSAEIVCAHVWMRRLVVRNQQNNLRKKKKKQTVNINKQLPCVS